MYVPVIKSHTNRQEFSAGGSSVVVVVRQTSEQGSSVVGSEVVVVVVVVVAASHEDEASKLQEFDDADHVHKQSPSHGDGVVVGKS